MQNEKAQERQKTILIIVLFISEEKLTWISATKMWREENARKDIEKEMPK